MNMHTNMNMNISMNQRTPKPKASQGLFLQGQIRLAELSVYNWGCFNNLHTVKIDPYGTLITGGNGSGKSTLADGLMALLLPASRASFNIAAAQGDRSDRTLLSYMRGTFSSAHDGDSGTRVRCKREGRVNSALRALYRRDDGCLITLAALFCMTQTTNALSDVKRVYIIAQKDIPFADLLNLLQDNNIRATKQWLKRDPSVLYCNDNFSHYQELYRKHLYMDNKNAPALLSRALGLKKIDDLTKLIRELVLEPCSLREEAKKVVDEFDNLVKIHERLIDARKQREHLLNLPQLKQDIEQAQDKIKSVSAEMHGLPIYFGEISYKLWTEKIKNGQTELEALLLLIKQVSERERDAETLVDRRHEAYIQAGGDRIEQTEQELSNATKELTRVITWSSEYQKCVRTLGWDDKLKEDSFLKNQSLLKERFQKTKEDERGIQDRFADISAKYSQLQQQQENVEEEISKIEKRPDSNIDVKFQQLRDELVASLNLKREQCVFIGELLDVDKEELPWQGAIERALGGVRTTLAVPLNSFFMVTRWLNVRHTGLHVRVQVVVQDEKDNMGYESHNRHKQQGLATFKNNGFLKKLVWRKHTYREWLKRHLARFDLQCVTSTEALDKTPFSMTRQGLIHKEKGRFEKRDQHKIDDRRRWQLGFSNKNRLAILRSDKKNLTEQLLETKKAVQKARENIDHLTARRTLLERLNRYQWDEVNAPYWEKKVSLLKRELEALKKKDSNLHKAKQRWEEAKGDREKIRLEKEEYKKREGGLLTTLEEAKTKREESRTIASEKLEDPVRNALEKRIGKILMKDLHQLNLLQNRHNEKMNQQMEGWRKQKSKAETQAINIIASFNAKDEWQNITIDWRSDTGIDSIGDYIAYLRKLEEEGLPDLDKRFKERLNKYTTQSLACIYERIESECSDILDRIDIINRVLLRTEFRSGTYLKLGAQKEKYIHVQSFEKEVKKVLSQFTSEDHEARFKQLKLVIKVLEKASCPSTANTLESLRLLDPRYRMSFYAEERDAKTNEVRDVLKSSSGKSGGEKESFAGTIVAASLAYVLTPEGQDRPVYSTVFLDEAFSNTAETVSRRVLHVFKKLHIHVNLITPYKNINLAREAARSLLIAEKSEKEYESQICEVTWEEIDRRLAQRHKQRAHNLDIQIDKETPQEMPSDMPK